MLLVHPNKVSLKNRARLPLQPTTQQISSILPSAAKKHKLPEESVSLSPLEIISIDAARLSFSEPALTSEPARKLRHYDSSSAKKVRKSRHRSLPKISVENATPSVPSVGAEPGGVILSKKRSSAELAAAAILSGSHLRKKRVIKKIPEESQTPSDLKHNDDPAIVAINDELLKRLSQGEFSDLLSIFDEIVSRRFRLSRPTHWSPLDRDEDPFATDEHASLSLLLETEDQSLREILRCHSNE